MSWNKIDWNKDGKKDWKDDAIYNLVISPIEDIDLDNIDTDDIDWDSMDFADMDDFVLDTSDEEKHPNVHPLIWVLFVVLLILWLGNCIA